MAATQSSELARQSRSTDPERQLPPGEGDGAGARARGSSVPEDLEKTGLVALLRDLAEDSRILVQQEIELAKMEVAATARRVAVDSAWIGAGVAIIAVAGLCLVLALALGLGALLDSYWLGTLITGGVLLLIGSLLAWKGVRDLTSGGFAPRDTVESLQEDREWAQREVDDFKQGIQKERA